MVQEGTEKRSVLHYTHLPGEKQTESAKVESGVLYRVREGFVIRAFADEYLVIPIQALDDENTKLAIISPVGQYIWTMLQKPCTFAQLLAGVTSAFEVDGERAASDIREFLQQLKEYHYLQQTEENEE